MKRNTDTSPADPTEGATLPSSARRVIVIARFLTHDSIRRRPQSIEADARLHAAHVRPAPFRPELY